MRAKLDILIKEYDLHKPLACSSDKFVSDYHQFYERPHLPRPKPSSTPEPAMHKPFGMRHVLPATTCPVAGGRSGCEASSHLVWSLAGSGT